VATFGFLKSTQKFNLPFFLGTMIIGDSQVTSSTSLMKPRVSSFSMSCLKMGAQLRFNW